MRVIAFDIFGTVFNVNGVPYSEKRAYVDHVRSHNPWRPLSLPKTWETLPAHQDSARGIELLRKKFIVVTCSNLPLGLQVKLSKWNQISWDGIIPLELRKVYKPNLEAYALVPQTLGFSPEECLMVTANIDSGDLDEPKKIGMQTQGIRKDGLPETIIHLATQLGC